MVIAEVVKPVVLVQVGIGAQVILASQPAPGTVVSEVKTNVKQPLAAEDVNGPGIVVPEKVPKSVPAELFPL